ncbi:MAG TPA: hypothetical protein VE641_09765, partial [Chthoniobacterales bacterium]|nr:hypothetical protein [Chthoniobacterales bacterium]
MAWLSTRRTPQGSKATAVKFTIAVPEGFALEPAAFRQGFSISPDGSQLAFTAMGEDGQNRLWIRALSELDSHELPAARGLHTVFWAPDGKSLYFGVSRSLRRIARDESGAYQIITDLSRRVPAAGAWLPANQLLLSNRQSTFLVPADGGKANELTETYLWPQILPDKQHILYLVYDQKLGRFRLRVAKLGQPTSGHDILETDSRASFVRSKNSQSIGYLVFVRAGTLLAQGFDSKGFQLAGDATPLAGDVHFFQPTGAADFSISETGTLVYQTLAKRSRIVWVDRSGRELDQVATGLFPVKYVRASRDARKVAAVIHNMDKGATEIWVFDRASKVNQIVVPGPGIIDTPVWSADSMRLLYARAVGSGPKLYGVGITDKTPEQALPSAEFQLATDWSQDSRYVLYNTENVVDGDIGLVDLKSKRAMPILSTSFHETGAVFSPDSRWVAFVANNSGRPEVYVQAFQSGDTPGLIGERRRVSEQGALSVRWRRDGKELLYLGTDGVLYSVAVNVQDLGFGRPIALFRIPIAWRAVLPTTFGFDVAEDGSRFLVAMTDEPSRGNFVVVENWEALVSHH